MLTMAEFIYAPTLILGVDFLGENVVKEFTATVAYYFLSFNSKQPRP